MEEFRDRARKAVDEKVLDAWIDELEVRERTVITPAGPFEIEQRGKEWLRASELLAAYAYGKPAQTIEKNVTITKRSPREYSLEELESLARGEVASADPEPAH